jgi:antitoxin component YwqK of YwqJK toxin-antitoxin module
MKHGEYKTFWSNGEIETYCFYVDDKLHGEYKKYYSNGELQIKQSYENGILI